MGAQNLPAKADTIRQLFEKTAVKSQLAAAIPRHMSVDRLLRVAMTAIRTNPKLADCTQKSLLACVMGCATLGLEPEPFLGQAYLIPFKNNGVLECTLIPGYRGYIALARRSGEVQSVSAQVVYDKDSFRLQYGLQETLDHIPADGDRGNPKGAYVVFRYKDGSHSFDYMSTSDIEKIRARSKSGNNGPWVTDWPEMAKKTVIRRHIKLAPLSVEMAKAAAIEEKFNLGESQIDLLTGEVAEEGELVDNESSFNDFSQSKLSGDTQKQAALLVFLTKTADAQKTTTEAIKEAAGGERFPEFWSAFEKWCVQPKQGEKRTMEGRKEDKKEKATTDKPKAGNTPQNGNTEAKDDYEQIPCPMESGEETRTRRYCRDMCMRSMDCTAWQK